MEEEHYERWSMTWSLDVALCTSGCKKQSITGVEKAIGM